MNIFLKYRFEKILHTDVIEQIKVIIYYNKLRTSNLVITNNSFSYFGGFQRTKVIYQFKCSLGDCISDNKNI